MRKPVRLLPYDVYERHTIVSRMVYQQPACGQVQQVLDVGGRAGLLQRFMNCAVIAVNVDGTGDMQYDGQTLPFKDVSFDVVTSIDTLEHLSQERRAPFVQECWRVARDCVILAAPYGSPGHMDCEKQLSEYYRLSMGKSHLYLQEHIRNGLPDQNELRNLVQCVQPRQSRLIFAGNYIEEAAAFRLVVQAHIARTLAMRFQTAWTHVRSLALFHQLTIRDTPSETSNRFYLQLIK